MPVELFSDNVATTLASSPAIGATSFTVTSSAGFPAAATGVSQFRALIDTEIVTVTNVSGTTWTCVALVAAHSAAVPVTHVITAAALRNLVVKAVNTVAASGAAQTIPDVIVATVNAITLTAACTLTFPTAAAGKSFTLVLVQGGAGSFTITWPATITKWVGGTAPTLTTAVGAVDHLSFTCVDGTNWSGFVTGLDVR